MLYLVQESASPGPLGSSLPKGIKWPSLQGEGQSYRAQLTAASHPVIHFPP